MASARSLPSAVPSGRRNFAPIAVAAACIAIFFYAGVSHAPALTDDSFQYIDAARSLASGECFCVHVAHFDEQIAFGRLPVPFTHFAPGYSMLMAALSFFGLSFTTAGLLLSAAGYAAGAGLLCDAATTLGAKYWAVALATLLWVVNSAALSDAARVGTEALFTACFAALAAIVARDIRSGGARPELLLLLGFAAGAGYDFRYAGVFLLPPVTLYLLWRAWRSPRALGFAIGGIALEAALAAPATIRNAIDTGSWRGAFGESAHRSLREVALGIGKAIYHVIVGDQAPAHLNLWAALFGLTLAVAVFFALRALLQKAWRTMAEYVSAAMAWIGCLIAAYLAGIVLTALLTISADLTRYLRPTYPVTLALLAPLLPIVLPGRRIAVAAMCVLSIFALDSESYTAPPRPRKEELAGNLLSRDIQPGVPARAWLLERVPPNGALLAVGGQAVSYVLHRNVVSVLAQPLTSRPTDERGYHELHARGTRTLPSPLSGLAAGRGPGTIRHSLSA